MTKKEDASVQEARRVADRLIGGFNEAVGSSEGKLDERMTLLVGIRGAMRAVRKDTTCGWVHKSIGNLLEIKQIDLIPE
jgi:hypothetical protein